MEVVVDGGGEQSALLFGEKRREKRGLLSGPGRRVTKPRDSATQVDAGSVRDSGHKNESSTEGGAAERGCQAISQVPEV